MASFFWQAFPVLTLLCRAQTMLEPPRERSEGEQTSNTSPCARDNAAAITRYLFYLLDKT